MEVPSAGQPSEQSSRSFSNDILKIEMAGPQHEHFSVIDLPGLFRSKERPGVGENPLIGSNRTHPGANHKRRHNARQTDGLGLSQQRESHYTVRLL